MGYSLSTFEWVALKEGGSGVEGGSGGGGGGWGGRRGRRDGGGEGNGRERKHHFKYPCEMT